MALLDNLPHTAAAYRRKRTKDSMGGSKDDFTTEVFTARACWRQPAGEREVQEFAKRGISVTDKIYFTTNPALTEQHILIISGTTYEVRSFSEPDASAGLGVLYRVMVGRSTAGSTG